MHEKLFFFGRYGSLVWMTFVQLIYMFSLLYAASMIYQSEALSYKAYEEGSRPKKIQILTGVIIAPAIIVFISFLELPKFLSQYAIATNVEMMKDRTNIERTLALQKFQKAKRTFRVYQVLKLIRRELISAMGREPSDKALREQTTRFVEQ